MDPLSIASLLVCGTALANACFVLLSEPRTFLKYLWALISFIAGVVGIHLFFLFNAADASEAYVHSLTINTVVIFVPIFFFHFALLLTNRLDHFRAHLIVYYVITFVYSAVVLCYPTQFIPNVGPVLDIPFYCRSGPLFYVLPFLFVVLMGHGLYLVFRSYRAAMAVRRNQLKYFFLGCFLGLIGAISAFLPAMNVAVYPWGIYVIPLSLTLVAYAIIKHQLMDIQIILRKSLIYTAVISLVMLVFFLFTFLAQRIFREKLGVTSDMESVIVIACVTMVIIPIYQMVQRLIDKMFYRGSFSQIVQENKRLHEEMLAIERYRTFTEISRSLIREFKEPIAELRAYANGNGVLLDNIRLIEETVHHLEDYSREVPAKYAAVNVIGALDQVVSSVQHDANNQKVAFFKYYQSDDVVKIMGDEDQLKRAFGYIFDHCQQVLSHEQERGDIFVTIEYDRSHVSFSIRHSGRGLRPEEIERLFSPFFKTRFFSCGLCLILTQSIVVQHGGKIWVESEEDSGTEFLIEFPIP